MLATNQLALALALALVLVLVKMQNSQGAESRTHILTSTPWGLTMIDPESSSSWLVDFPANSNRVKKKKKSIILLGSCHGLVALALVVDGGSRASVYDEKEEEFYLWNPLTGDYKKLPQHPILPDSSPPAFAKYYTRIVVSGFGYDSHTDDYKVFVLKQYGGIIFSVRRNSWRGIGEPSLNSYYPGDVGCLVNGTLHWVSFGRITGLDLKTEGYVVVAVPDNKRLSPHKFPQCRTGVLDGKLCLSFFYPHHYEYRDPSAMKEYGVSPEIWVMNDYGVKESWTKLLTFCEGIHLKHLPFALTTSGSGGSKRTLISATINYKKKELIRYEYDDAKGKGKISQRFRICDCDDDAKLRFNHPCRALLCSETLYFPFPGLLRTSSTTYDRKRKQRDQ